MQNMKAADMIETLNFFVNLSTSPVFIILIMTNNDVIQIMVA